MKRTLLNKHYEELKKGLKKAYRLTFMTEGRASHDVYMSEDGETIICDAAFVLRNLLHGEKVHGENGKIFEYVVSTLPGVANDMWEAYWDAMPEKGTDEYDEALKELVDDIIADETGWLDAIIDEQLEEKTKLFWYAVQETDEDPWDYGSFDWDEAAEMLLQQGHGLIAVIDNPDDDGFCIGEYSYDDVKYSYCD